MFLNFHVHKNKKFYILNIFRDYCIKKYLILKYSHFLVCLLYNIYIYIPIYFLVFIEKNSTGLTRFFKMT